MDAKTLLSKDKKLLQWWASVVEDERFEQVKLILKAHVFEGRPSPDQMIGVTTFIESMTSIIDPEEAPTVYAQPGLSHDLESPRRTINSDKPKTKK